MKLLGQVMFNRSPRLSGIFFLVLLHCCSPAGSLAQEWIYTVETGDNLWKLSKKHLKSIRYWKQLVELNNVDDPYNLRPGTSLRFPVEWLKSGSSVATIIELTGEATIIAQNRDHIVQAQKGMLLWDYDLIKTAGDSNVTLQFSDGSRILVQAESEMKIEKLMSYGASGMADTKVRLKSGRTHNKVTPRTGQGSRFEISTPSAIAAVRGTEYRISAEGSGESKTEVLTGVVGVDSSGNVQTVPEGFGTVSFKNRKPLSPVTLLPAPDLSMIPKTFRRIPFSFKSGQLDGARQFRIQIAGDEEFSTLLVDKTFPTNNLWGPDLPDDTYFLRVNGIDSNGLEGMYSVHSFSLEAHPLPPLQIHPPAEKVIDQSVVTFKWSKPQDASRYLFQLSRVDQFKRPLIIDETNLDNTTFTPGFEIESGIYYWRVASVAENGKIGPFSDPLKFRKSPPLPDMSEAELDMEEMVFRWRKAEAGQTYRCQISRDSDFSELLVDEELTDSHYSLKQFAYGSYYIRVAITDSDGYTGPFAPYQTAEIPAPPPHPLTIIIPTVLTLLLLL